MVFRIPGKMIEGKISVKHYLNDKVAKRNGQLPLYVLVRFQNKDSRFKSRWKFFDYSNIAPLSPLHVVPAYKEQADYFSEKDVAEKHIQTLCGRESNAIIQVGDYFKRLDINFIEHEPSVLFDHSIVPIKELLSDIYTKEFMKKLGVFMENGKYFSLWYFLTETIESNIDFGTIIRALYEVSSKEANRDFLNEWIDIEDQRNLIAKNIRVIDWLASESVRNSSFDELDPAFAKKFKTDIGKALVTHFSEIRLPKGFKLKFLT